MDWTGLESSGLGIAPANLDWQGGHRNPEGTTGDHCSQDGLCGGG